jgi:hypothetical protein
VNLLIYCALFSLSRTLHLYWWKLEVNTQKSIMLVACHVLDR